MAEQLRHTLLTTNDQSIRLPVEWLDVLGWEKGSDIIVDRAEYDKFNKCRIITLKKVPKKPK